MSIRNGRAGVVLAAGLLATVGAVEFKPLRLTASSTANASYPTAFGGPPVDFERYLLEGDVVVVGTVSASYKLESRFVPIQVDEILLGT